VKWTITPKKMFGAYFATLRDGRVINQHWKDQHPPTSSSCKVVDDSKGLSANSALSPKRNCCLRQQQWVELP
jgi:hypothetical protein